MATTRVREIRIAASQMHFVLHQLFLLYMLTKRTSAGEKCGHYAFPMLRQRVSCGFAWMKASLDFYHVLQFHSLFSGSNALVQSTTADIWRQCAKRIQKDPKGRNIKGNSFGPSRHRRQAAVNSHTHSSQTSLWISPQDHAEPRMADRIKKIKPVEGIQKTLLRDCFEPSRIAPMFWILEATPGLNRWALLVHLARLTRL